MRFEVSVHHHFPEGRPGASESEIAALVYRLNHALETTMALSARAQAIVDRVNALAANLNQKIAADEAAHDAANAAAVDADDTAIEGALTTLEGSVAAPATGGDTLPAG